MIKKIFKYLTVFSMVTGILFSNLPYRVLIQALDSYIAAQNIVDKAWHLSRDENIVDTFTSYRHLVEKIKVYEAHAAAPQYVGGTTCTGTGSTYSCSLTALTGGIGSSAAADDLVIVVTGWASTANGDPGVTTTGYTEINAVDYYSNDTRDANASFNYKKMGATPDTSVTVRGFNNAGNGGATAVHVWRGVDPTTPLDVTTTAATGGNAARPNSPSITPVTADAIVLTAGLGTGDTSPLAFTAPTGYSNGMSAQGAGTSMSAIAVIASKAWVSGAEDPAAWGGGETTTSDSWAAASIVLRPAPPANNPPTLSISQPDGVGDTVTVGAAYNITYSLSDPDNIVTAAFFYDTNNTGLDGTAITGACATAAEGTNVTCSWDTTGITPGSYFVYGTTNDGVNPTVSAYSSGTITINAPPAGPDATSYTNGADTNLNFSACASTGCGGRIGQAITITGTAFGTVTGDANEQNCAGGAGTGCVRIGNYTVPGTSISSWADTSITFTVPSAITVYGGAGTACGTADGNGICVTAASTNDAGGSLTFWVAPDVTSISPSAAGEGQEGASVTITGTRFGASQGTVRFQNCGDNAGSIGAWGDTSITVTVPTAVSDNDDLCDVRVIKASQSATAASSTDVSTNFIVLPDITSLAVCGSCAANAAREYNGAGDYEGLVMLQGNHFGTTAGTVQFTGGFGTIAATLHAAEQHCTVGNWAAAGTSVCIEVNSTIGNSAYTGTITLTRTGDSKTDVASFRVLPQITSTTPASGTNGDTVKVVGDHFCQSGTCPVSPNRNTAADNVKFGSTAALDSDFVNGTGGAGTCDGAGAAWVDAEICVKVPAAAGTGSQPILVTSNTNYTSSTSAFSVSSTVPNDPATLQQFKADGSTAISTGGTTNESSVVLKASMSGFNPSTLCLQIENAAVATAFTGTVTAEEGGPGQQVCKSYVGTPVTGQVTITGLTSGSSYHWRARVKNSGTGQTSNWVSFGGNTENPPTNPADADYIVDSVGPTITGDGAADPCAVATTASTCDGSSPSDLQAQIRWATNENADRQVGYDTSCPAGASAAAVFSALASKEPASPSAVSTSPHSASLSGLSANTTYHFKVRAADAAGNISYSPSGTTCLTFTTQAAQTRLMKTLDIFIQQATTTTLTNAFPANFDVFIAESNTSRSNITIRSAFVEVWGISRVSSGDITVNAAFSGDLAPAGSTAYTVSPGGTNATYWIVTKQVSGWTGWDCAGCTDKTNTVDVTVTGTGIVNSIVGARMYTTYNYVPQ